jgi:flagellar biosynthesis/type III secretory pathway M-ring protein FliF/YscJ
MNKNQKIVLAIVIVILTAIVAALSIRRTASQEAPPVPKMPKLDISAPRFSE